MSGTAPGELQASFAAALLSPEPSARPAFLTGGVAERFSIYRNNFHHGLGTQMAEAYPVVRRLVGERFFQACASAFIVREPPRSRSLALYGAGFPAFLQGFEPAAALPYLPDVARLERGRLEALHAADAAPLTPHGLTALAGEDARLERHPASRLVTSPHPILDIWAANQADAAPGPRCLPAVGQCVLITRPAREVRLLALTPAQAAFARRALDGQALDAAYEAALEDQDDFDLTATLCALLVAGAFRAPADATGGAGGLNDREGSP
jgi:hypothetical protein